MDLTVYKAMQLSYKSSDARINGCTYLTDLIGWIYPRHPGMECVLVLYVVIMLLLLLLLPEL